MDLPELLSDRCCFRCACGWTPGGRVCGGRLGEERLDAIDVDGDEIIRHKLHQSEQLDDATIPRLANRIRIAFETGSLRTTQSLERRIYRDPVARPRTGPCLRVRMLSEANMVSLMIMVMSLRPGLEEGILHGPALF